MNVIDMNSAKNQRKKSEIPGYITVEEFCELFHIGESTLECLNEPDGHGFGQGLIPPNYWFNSKPNVGYIYEEHAFEWSATMTYDKAHYIRGFRFCCDDMEEIQAAIDNAPPIPDDAPEHVKFWANFFRSPTHYEDG